MLSRLRARWASMSFEDRAVNLGVLGFWLIILGLIVLIHTGRWP